MKRTIDSTSPHSFKKLRPQYASDETPLGRLRPRISKSEGGLKSNTSSSAGRLDFRFKATHSTLKVRARMADEEEDKKLQEQFAEFPNNRPATAGTPSPSGKKNSYLSMYTPGGTRLNKTKVYGDVDFFTNTSTPPAPPSCQALPAEELHLDNLVEAPASNIKTQTIHLTLESFKACERERAQTNNRRIISQQKAMAKKGLVKASDVVKSEEHQEYIRNREWLHLLAWKFLGLEGQVPSNLVAGNADGNSDMMLLEETIKPLLIKDFVNRVGKLVDEVFSDDNDLLSKKAALDAMNKVLGEETFSNQPIDSNEIIKKKLSKIIRKKYTRCENMLGAFLGNIQDPAIGLPDNNPLKNYKDQNDGINITVTATLKPGTHIAETITYTILLPNGKHKEFVFDAQTTIKPHKIFGEYIKIIMDNFAALNAKETPVRNLSAHYNKENISLPKEQVTHKRQRVARELLPSNHSGLFGKEDIAPPKERLTHKRQRVAKGFPPLDLSELFNEANIAPPKEQVTHKRQRPTAIPQEISRQPKASFVGLLQQQDSQRLNREGIYARSCG
jgi:hypothetical protein